MPTYAPEPIAIELAAFSLIAARLPMATASLDKLDACVPKAIVSCPFVFARKPIAVPRTDVSFFASEPMATPRFEAVLSADSPNATLY